MALYVGGPLDGQYIHAGSAELRDDDGTPMTSRADAWVLFVRDRRGYVYRDGKYIHASRLNSFS